MVFSTPRFRIRTGARTLIVRNTSWSTRGLIYWKPDWKTALISHVVSQRGGTFLDVGANIGQTLVDFLAAPAQGRYIGFEPNHICAQQIDRVIADNDLRGRCSVVPVGLSDATEIIPLYLAPGEANDTGATIMADLRPNREYATTLIPVYRLDDIADRLGIDEVALIKIDVEGAELQVLHGMTAMLKNSKPWIICEILHRDSQAAEQEYMKKVGDIAQFLADHSYEAYQLVKDESGANIIDLVRTV